MDRKSLPLIVLCFVLILSWQPIVDWLIPPPPSKPASPHGEQGKKAVTPSTADARSAHGTASSEQAGGGHSKPVSDASPLVSTGLLRRVDPSVAKEAVRVTLENAQMKVILTSVGGGIESVTLKTFEEGGKPVVLNEGSPVPAMAVSVGDTNFQSSYEWRREGSKMVGISRSSEGLQITREFALGEGFQIETKTKILHTGKIPFPQLTLAVALGMSGPMNPMDTEEYVGLAIHSGEHATHEMMAALRKYFDGQGVPFEKSGPVDWVALNNQYFTLLTAPETSFARVQAQPVSLPTKDTETKPTQQFGAFAVMDSAPFSLAPGASVSWDFSIYAGPKEYRQLAALGRGQQEALDFRVWGMELFAVVSKALIYLTSFFHGIFGNWGVAIICVTILIKIIFWPLTAISTRSMKQMQALSPKINALKEKYGNNTQKMNEEMMKLYRDYKINPMAGCLPMLVQIPIFIAFYNMLRTAVELRGAHFLWIHDLARPDTVATIPLALFHLHINPMPLLMVCTMIWQTRITPQPPNADPSMKIMMWIMPVTFLLICYNFSSGLSLYWTAQNLLTVLQTYLTRDQKVDPPQKTKTKGGFTFSRPIDSQK